MSYSCHMSPKAKEIKILLIALSLFVFLLALDAKLSLYEQPAQVDATNSSKLWLSGQKMETQTPPVLVLAVLSLAFVLLRPRFQRSPLPTTQLRVPRPSAMPAFEFHRFLRPPPNSSRHYSA